MQPTLLFNLQMIVLISGKVLPVLAMRSDVPYFTIYSVQRQTILPTASKWVTRIAACCPPDFYSYSV